jgi:hypothetical protein
MPNQTTNNEAAMESNNSSLVECAVETQHTKSLAHLKDPVVECTVLLEYSVLKEQAAEAML